MVRVNEPLICCKEQLVLVLLALVPGFNQAFFLFFSHGAVIYKLIANCENGLLALLFAILIMPLMPLNTIPGLAAGTSAGGINISACKNVRMKKRLHTGARLRIRMHLARGRAHYRIKGKRL